jgi:hypothetical protein
LLKIIEIWGFFVGIIGNGGEGGIRTRGTRNGYNALAGRRFQPLTHLSICGIKLYQKNFILQVQKEKNQYL